MKINVYVPNMPNRMERRSSIMGQFENKDLFSLNIVRPVDDPDPRISLWRTFVRIVREESEHGSDFFIFCEDDHVFTANYSDRVLLRDIAQSQHLGADIMSGGVSWYDMPVRVSDGLFWINEFTGMQFTVIFKKFYSRILNSGILERCALDLFLSTISDNIFVAFPYLSVQKEFGYSDVTINNNTTGIVSKMFERNESRLRLLNKIYDHYSQQDND